MASATEGLRYCFKWYPRVGSPIGGQQFVNLVVAGKRASMSVRYPCGAFLMIRRLSGSLYCSSAAQENEPLPSESSGGTSCGGMIGFNLSDWHYRRLLY
jgi:hypothetical protein